MAVVSGFLDESRVFYEEQNQEQRRWLLKTSVPAA